MYEFKKIKTVSFVKKTVFITGVGKRLRLRTPWCGFLRSPNYEMVPVNADQSGFYFLLKKGNTRRSIFSHALLVDLDANARFV